MCEIDKTRLFEGITYIDPAFVEEANKPLERKPAHIIWLKKAGALAAAFLFVVAVLFSINAAFPAFAESLPLVGEIFRQLNSIGSNAPSYEGVVQGIGVSAGNDQYEATVTEAYCDGDYVFFALRLQVKDTKLLKMETLYTEEAVEGHDAPGWSISINGKGAPGYDLPVFTRKGSYFESNAIRVNLPEGMGTEETIQVEAFMGNLYGRGQVLSTDPVSLCFDVTTNTRYNQQEQVQNAAIDGLDLQTWGCSPSKLSVTLDYPYFGRAGVYAHACTGDGLDLGEDTHENGGGDFGDGRYSFGDTALQECTFVGPPEGTKTVVITVYKEPPADRAAGSAAFGEFTVDLETGNVRVTDSYLEEGFTHQSITEYARLQAQAPQPEMPVTSGVPRG